MLESCRGRASSAAIYARTGSGAWASSSSDGRDSPLTPSVYRTLQPLTARIDGAERVRVVNRFRPFMYPDDSVVMSKPRFLLDGDGLALLPNPTSDPLALGDPRVVEQTLSEHDAWYFPGTFADSPLNRSMLVRIARTAAYQESRLALVRNEHGYPPYDQQGEAYQITGRILTQFAAQVRDDGATPVAVIYPGERDLGPSAGGPGCSQRRRRDHPAGRHAGGSRSGRSRRADSIAVAATRLPADVQCGSCR